MRLLDLRDNALFLQNWRERMRLPSVLSGVILSTVIIVLIFLNAYLNPPETRQYLDGKYTAVPIFWLDKVFWDIGVFQGVVLFLFGTLAANKMTVRERSSGTLDFHRSSPTPRVNQYLGLLFGAPSLEWCLFLGSFLVSLLVFLFSNIPAGIFVQFYLSLVLCAVFYHSLAILFAVAVNRKGVAAQRSSGFLVIMLSMYGLSGILYSMNLAVFYHLTWLPVYDQLSHFVFGATGYRDNAWIVGQRKAVSSFFTVPLPQIVLLALVQVPFLSLAAIGIFRKISFPERQIFSKSQLSIFNATVLFLVVGSLYSAIFYNASRYKFSSRSEILPFFIMLIILLGIVTVLCTTPTQLQFLKGLRRSEKIALSGDKKIRAQGFPLDDDHNSNVLAMITFAMTAAVMFGILGFLLPYDMDKKVMAMALLLCYVATSAGILEWFQLSRHHKKVVLFWTIVGIVWIFLPILGEIVRSASKESYLYHAFRSFSPFWGVELIIRVLTDNKPFYRTSGEDFYSYFVMTFIINLVSAVVTQLLAAQERRALTRQVFQKAPEMSG